MADYLLVAAWYADIVRELDEQTPEASSAKVVPLFDHVCLPSAPVLPATEPTPARMLMSRRGMLAGAIAAGLSGFGLSELTSVINPTRPTVIDSGHVLRMPLNGGVMHAARNSLFEIDRRHAAQTVRLQAGQAAFQFWDGVRAITRVLTPWGEIAVAAARFWVLVLESMLVVTVAEGSVRVVSSEAHLGAMVLTAGQKLTIRAGDAQVASIAAGRTAREFAWTQGDLYFDGETLLEAAATFNRFNVLQISPSPALAHLSVGAHQCDLSDPQRFVARFVADWALASRTVDNVIHIYKRDEAPEHL
jgi:ferric-dicitrate binding protein FerR (iron transport regulator)